MNAETDSLVETLRIQESRVSSTIHGRPSRIRDTLHDLCERPARVQEIRICFTSFATSFTDPGFTDRLYVLHERPSRIQLS